MFTYSPQNELRKKQMQHVIFHIELCNFFTAAIEKSFPSLQNRPFVIVSQAQSRHVLAVSPAARYMGITKGMLLRDARKIDRRLAVHPAEVQLFEALNRELVKIVAAYSPVIESWRQGNVYLDMMHRRARREVMRDTAFRVRKEIVRRLALPAAVGLGANKLISRAASSQAAKQNEIIEVPFGQEKSFLVPFWVGILPHADRGVVKALHSINIHKVGDLQALSEPDLRDLFGRNGLWLHREAQGVDLSPVQPIREGTALHEAQRLTPPSNDFYLLKSICSMLLGRLAWQLRRRGVCARRMTLSATYQDGRFFSRGCKITGRAETEERLLPAAQSLLDRLALRRVAVQRLAINLSQLDSTRQCELFDGEPARGAGRLTAALDTIQDRFGERAIRWGRQIRCQ